jgi:hypothetical protein
VDYSASDASKGAQSSQTTGRWSSWPLILGFSGIACTKAVAAIRARTIRSIEAAGTSVQTILIIDARFGTGRHRIKGQTNCERKLGGEKPVGPGSVGGSQQARRSLSVVVPATSSIPSRSRH